MIGVWIGSGLLCSLAVRHCHRVMVVVPFHRVLRMFCLHCVVHGRHRRSGSHVTMRQPAAHQRGEQHQQQGKPSRAWNRRWRTE